MRLLLDTHALIWCLTNNLRLSKAALQAIADPENEIKVSAITGYEITYKQSRGRLPGDLSGILPQLLRRERIGALEVGLEDMLEAAKLPGPHRDPWDRILMAQARLSKRTVISVDPVFGRYGIPVLW